MSEVRCAHCGRLVKHPVDILGLVFGSECQALYAGLEGALQSAGIEFPVSFALQSTEGGFYAVTAQIREFSDKVRAFGAALAFSDGIDPSTGLYSRTFTGLKRIVNTNAIQSHTRTQAMFEAKLHGGL